MLTICETPFTQPTLRLEPADPLPSKRARDVCCLAGINKETSGLRHATYASDTDDREAQGCDKKRDPESLPAAAASVRWGVDGGVPVPADYDNDRKTDLAVYRAGSPNGTCWVRGSVGTTFAFVLGCIRRPGRAILTRFDISPAVSLAVARDELMNDHEKVKQILQLKDQAPLVMDPGRSALLIVDTQRYFARPEYAFGQTFERLVPGSTTGYFDRVARGVMPNIARLIERFREANVPVIFIGAGSHTDDGRDLPEWLRDFNQLSEMVAGRRAIPPVNDESWEIDERIAPRPGEIVLNKTSSGPLNSTKLDQLLHNMGISNLVVCGLTTAICVAQTARESADRGFRVVIASDACTEMSEEMHVAALEAFSLTFGRTRTTDQLLEIFSNAPATQSA